MNPYKIHFWGIAGGVNAGFEKTFFPENNITFPFDGFKAVRFQDERLLLKRLFSNGLKCRIDIVDDCIALTRYKSNSDRENRPAFTAATFYFDSQYQLNPNLVELKAIDNALVDCIDTQKTFFIGSLKYPKIDDVLPSVQFSNNPSSKSRIKKVFVIGAGHDTMRSVIDKLQMSRKQNALVYFINSDVDIAVKLQNVLSVEELKTYSVFNAKDIDFYPKIHDFFGLNASKNIKFKRVKRISIAVLAMSLIVICCLKLSSIPHKSKALERQYPIALKEVVFIDKTGKGNVNLFDSLFFKITTTYQLTDETTVFIESTSHKSLIFESIEIRPLDVDSGFYLLSTVLSNDTTLLSSSIVQVNSFISGNDTCTTNFNLEI